jgi:hypothetical protein
MAKIVDNIELDEANAEFNLAVDLVKKEKNLFI